VRILVVDNHPLIRKGLVSILSFERDVEQIREASCIKEAVGELINFKPDISLLEIRLGKENGLEIVSSAKRRDITTKFIVFTSSFQKEDFFKCHQANVDGYILKQAIIEDILYAFHVVTRGKRYYDPEVMRFQTQNIGNSSINELSDREKDVLMELKKGLSNFQIAQTLYISENTVKKHVSNILFKLGLSHRTEAALFINNSLNTVY
jgi:DNA-binding NarL/FixJ family response regulator